MTPSVATLVGEINDGVTSFTGFRATVNAPGTTTNDIIAGNGRVPKAYMFIQWLYLLKTYIKYLMLCVHSF